MEYLAPWSLLGAVKGVFTYNRENFIFDRKLAVEKLYHTQKMRLEQVLLYREDLRDLFDLTIRKMDIYLIMNSFTLFFAAAFFYEGRLPAATAGWIIWLWTMTLGASLFFLFLSVWFAIYASITAQTFLVRLMTQWLRLPVPGRKEINAATRSAVDYEKARVKDMLRIPILGKLSGLKDVGDKLMDKDINPDPHSLDIEPEPPVHNDGIKEELLENYDLFMEHFYLFAELQKHWQGFDAYSRVCMVIGTNQFISAISYMAIAYFFVDVDLEQWGTLGLVVILFTFSMIHARMNLHLSETRKIVLYVLNWTGPAFACAAAAYQGRRYHSLLILLMNMANGEWSSPLKPYRREGPDNIC